MKCCSKPVSYLSLWEHFSIFFTLPKSFFMLVCAKDINLKRQCQSHCKLLKHFLTLQIKIDGAYSNTEHLSFSFIRNKPLTKKHIWFDYSCEGLKAASEVVTTEHLSGFKSPWFRWCKTFHLCAFICIHSGAGDRTVFETLVGYR